MADNTQNDTAKKQGVAKFWFGVKKDWCHFCGNRFHTAFAEVQSYDNAEHALLFPKRLHQQQYHRVCAACVKAMAEVVEQAGPIWV